MLSFHRLDSALTLLALCCGVHILYRKGSHKYPRAIIDITSNAELQLLLLTLFLSATMFLWAMKLSDHQRLLASLFSDMYQFFIPPGSRWWLKWAWAAYFGLFLTILPLKRGRAALRRIRRKTPIGSARNEARSGLWAYVMERRRLRRAREEDQARLAASSQTFPQDAKIDLERSSPDSTTTTGVVAEEPTQSTAEILAENSTIRRSQALRAVTAEWIQLVLVGCYLDNQLAWNANVPDWLGMYLDLLTLMYMYRFPASWAMSFATLYEAAIDNQEAVALAATARREEDGLNGVNAEKGPLIVVTEAL